MSGNDRLFADDVAARDDAGIHHELARVEEGGVALIDAAARLEELDERLGTWSVEGFRIEPWRRRISAERSRVESAVASLADVDGGGAVAAVEGVERLAADLEGLAARQRDNAVRLARNAGIGRVVFEPPTTLTRELTLVTPHDVDGDVDLDLFALDRNTLIWIENKLDCR